MTRIEFEKNVLYSKKFTSMLNFYLYHLVPNKIDREDVIATTFARAWNKFETYDDRYGSLEVWIKAIARNYVYDQFRLKKNKIEKTKEVIYRKDNFSVNYFGPKNDGFELKEALEIAIENLNETHKNCWKAYETQNLSYEEISKIYGYNTSTVKCYIHRARKELQKKLIEFI